MGRKAGYLFINGKKFGDAGTPCMREMTSFLNCLALCQNDSEKCGHQKQFLSICVEKKKTVVTDKNKPWGSINYHLQRLSRFKK